MNYFTHNKMSRRSRNITSNNGTRRCRPLSIKSEPVSTDSTSKTNSDWQSQKTLAECNMEMLSQGHMTDVMLHVGYGTKREIIRAHKYVLASRSSEFFTLFNRKTSSDNIIIAEDIRPATFHTLLRYIYTDEVELTADNVTSVMHAAKKYNIQGLVKLCGQKLSEGLDVTTVCTLLEQSHKYSEGSLQNECLNFIYKHAEDIFRQPTFLNLCSTCMTHIFQSDHLHATECSVYQAVYDWSTRACRKNKLQPTPYNRHRMLGKLLYLIRFPLLDVEYFTQTVVPHGLLSKPETAQLYHHFNSRSSPVVGPFINRRRVLSRAIRFQTTSGAWNVGRYIFDSIRLQSSNNVNLIGIVIYGCYSDQAAYDVSVRILNEKSDVIARKELILDTDADDEYYNIVLDKSVPIPATTWFTIMLHMEGPQTKRGILGKDMVYSEREQFFFQESKFEHNCTSVNEGQIPGILFH